MTSFTETTTARHQLRHRSWSAIPRRDPTQPRFTVFRSLFFCNHRNLACRSFTGSTSFPELAEMDSEDLFLNHPRRKLFLLLDLNVCVRAGRGGAVAKLIIAAPPQGESVRFWSRSRRRKRQQIPHETGHVRPARSQEKTALSVHSASFCWAEFGRIRHSRSREGSAHALPFLPYLLMVALHHDTIIQTSSQENSTLSVHSAPSASMPVQRGTGFTPQR